MDTIISYLQNMLISILPTIPLIVVCRVLVNVFLYKTTYKSTVLHELGVVAFSLYVLAIYSQTVDLYTIINNGISLKGNINLIPFKSILSIFQTGELTYIVINILGNIILFIPFGFFISLLWAKTRFLNKVLLLGFLFSLSIETTQLFQYRGSDIDDLILNTAGAILGYLVYLLLIKSFGSLPIKFTLKNQGVEKMGQTHGSNCSHNKT